MKRQSVTKNQIADQRSQVSMVQARTGQLLMCCILILVAMIPGTAALWYVHETKGSGVVLSILAIIGVLAVFVLGAYIVDRFQERSTRFNANVVASLGAGMSAAMAQQARTQGEMDRSSLRVLTNQRLQEQRIGTSRQLADMRQSSPSYDFDDEPVDAEIVEVF